MFVRSKLCVLLCAVAVLLTAGAVAPVRAETFRNPQRIALPSDPYGLTTGDLDGNGLPDIVWTEIPAAPAVGVLHVLLAAGGGQYTAAPSLTLPFPASPVQCVVEDVTGDKRNDLVCAAISSSNAAHLITYPGNGDGTFGAPVQTRLNTSYDISLPILARAPDLNGDGLPDVMVTQAYLNTIYPYLSDGKGGFKPAPSPFLGSFNFSVPTVTDLNGDGKADVLWPTGPRVNLGNGDGTFSAPVQYDPGYLSNCAFGDVDKDGHLDAVCVWNNESATTAATGMMQLTVLHGNPDGSFNKTPLFTRGFDVGDINAGSATIIAPVLVADLNGDGYADIVASSGDGYCVLLGGPNTTWNGAPQQFVDASFQSQSFYNGIYGTSFADMNGDGLPDIVAIGPNGIYITYAQADGTLSSAPTYEVGNISTSVALADFNGDGNLDVVSAGDVALKLSLGRGDGSFGAPQPITTSGDFSTAVTGAPRVVSGDFNGDGKQDLLAMGSAGASAAQNYILFGRGDGTFTAPSPTIGMVGTVADLNGDGRSDVYAIQNDATNGNTLTVDLSRGDGSFTPVVTQLPKEMSSSYVLPMYGPALANYRHSGLLDAVVATENNAYLLKGHGDGSFDASGTALPVPDLASLKKMGVADIATGDFDGDGNPDFAVLAGYGGPSDMIATSSAVWVFYGKGDGTFSAPVNAGVFNRGAQTLHSGDLNGDGLADLVLTSSTVYQDNGVLLVHSMPGRTWGPEADYTGGEGLSPLWIADVNHDGRNDLVISNADRGNYTSDSVAVLLNEAAATVNGTLTASPEPSNVTYPFTLKVALSPSGSGDVLTGSVTFSVDGTVVGTAALSGNVASLPVPGAGLAAGTHILTAFWPGSGSYPSLNLSATHTIQLLPLGLSLSAAPASLSVGGTVVATTTFSPAVAPDQASYTLPGTLTLYDNGVAVAQQQVAGAGFSFTLSALAAGTHTLQTAYAGDSLFAAAQSNAVTVTVAGAPSVAVLSASPASASYGTPVTLTAKVAAAAAGSAAVPTGTVTFAVDGVAQPPVPLASAVATTTLRNLGTGGHTTSCTYSGDSSYAAASCNVVPVTITTAATSLNLTVSSNPAYALAPVSFFATLSSGGSPVAGQVVVFSLDGAVLGSAATDAAGLAMISSPGLQIGSHAVAASFAGTASYQGSAASATEQVNANATVTVLAASPNPVNQGAALALQVNTGATTGVATPAGTVTVLDGTTVVGTLPLAAGAGKTAVATGALTTLAPGQHVLTAVYMPASTAFLASQSAAVTVTVNPSGLTVATDPGTITLATGHHTNVAVTLTSVGTLSGTYRVSCGSLPEWVSCMWTSGSTATLTAGSTAGLQLTVDTDAVNGYGSYQPQQASLAGRRGVFALLAVLSPLGLLWRRRRGLGLVVAVLAAVTLAGLAGCSGRYPDSTPPGTYSVPLTVQTVTGTSATQTINVGLVVTP